MRPDIVKLDMSLIDGDNADHIASTTVALTGYRDTCDALVIAEGIESPDDLIAASTLGATHLQGYLFGKPVMADELSDQPYPWCGETAQSASPRILLAISRHLEGLAGHPDTIVLAAFEHANRFTERTRQQYTALAKRCGFVGVAAPCLTVGTRSSVHYGSLPPRTSLAGHWCVVVMHPEGGTALDAVRDSHRPGWYHFTLTTCRETINGLATEILRHL